MGRGYVFANSVQYLRADASDAETVPRTEPALESLAMKMRPLFVTKGSASRAADYVK